MSETYTTFLTVMASAKQIDRFVSLGDGYYGTVSTREFVCYGRNRLDLLLNKETRILYYNKSYKVESWETYQDGGYFLKIRAIIIE